jgi:hypothetical protein
MTTPRSPSLIKHAPVTDEVDDPIVELDVADEQAIDRALASIREGRGISPDTFRALLRRL